jgi:malate/lactate dehydrogenase
MRHKVTVVGGDGVGATCAQHLAEGDYADVVTSLEEVSGSHVVVVAADTDAAAIRERAPDAVLVVANEPVAATCRALYDATLFPRERIIGVADAAAAIDAVEAVLFDRRRVVPCLAMRDKEFTEVHARLGCCGIEEFA